MGEHPWRQPRRGAARGHQHSCPRWGRIAREIGRSCSPGTARADTCAKMFFFFASSRAGTLITVSGWQMRCDAYMRNRCLLGVAGKFWTTGGAFSGGLQRIWTGDGTVDPCARPNTHLRRQDRPPPAGVPWHHLPCFLTGPMRPSEADRRSWHPRSALGAGKPQVRTDDDFSPWTRYRQISTQTANEGTG